METISQFKKVLFVLGGMLMLAHTLYGEAAAKTGTAQRPNIVFILSDDQAWTDYGFMGHADIKTPHLDRLSERGCCSNGVISLRRCAVHPWLRWQPGSIPSNTG